MFSKWDTITGLRILFGRSSFISGHEDRRFYETSECETISVFGISGGGMGAMYLSACDSRIDHMILSGYPCTWPDTLFVHHHCIDNFVPGMTRIADGPQIISLFCTKTFAFIDRKN